MSNVIQRVKRNAVRQMSRESHLHYSLFNGWDDPASVVRDLGKLKECLATWSWLKHGGHHSICLRTFTDQWTSWVSLKGNTQSAVITHGEKWRSLLLFYIKLQNVHTWPGPVSPSEQYMFSFAHSLLSIKVTLISMSLGDIISFFQSARPQPETTQDFGRDPSSWFARAMGVTWLLTFALESNFKNNDK